MIQCAHIDDLVSLPSRIPRRECGAVIDAKGCFGFVELADLGGDLRHGGFVLIHGLAGDEGIEKTNGTNGVNYDGPEMSRGTWELALKELISDAVGGVEGPRRAARP